MHILLETREEMNAVKLNKLDDTNCSITLGGILFTGTYRPYDNDPYKVVVSVELIKGEE